MKRFEPPGVLPELLHPAILSIDVISESATPLSSAFVHQALLRLISFKQLAASIHLTWRVQGPIFGPEKSRHSDSYDVPTTWGRWAHFLARELQTHIHAPASAALPGRSAPSPLCRGQIPARRASAWLPGRVRAGAADFLPWCIRGRR